jgi:hypothetical protein
MKKQKMLKLTIQEDLPMRTMILILLTGLLVVTQSFAGVTAADRHYTGLHPTLPMNWERAENWDSTKVPGLFSAVHIGFSAPYVAVSGTLCESYILNIHAGGKLALRASDNARFLVVINDLLIDAGGFWKKEGPDGTTGPIVVIGGDIENRGTINLKGVSTGQEQVILAGCHQTIRGSADIVFQTLRSLTKFTVDGVDVYVTGKYNGPWPNVINGGNFIVGEAPLPITLASFSAAAVAGSNGVSLQWRTVTEVDNYGFYVERRAAGSTVYQAVDFIATQGNGIVPHDYAYVDATVAGGNWYYRLRQVDLTGDESTTDEVLVEVQGVTAVATESVPDGFALQQNYPNPFNPETAIRFAVQTAGQARLVVYDALGQEVATLFDGVAEPGRFYNVRFGGTGLSSGVYFYRLNAGAQTDMKRMLLMK